jgi:glycosyltransferase involved in cell wall biosynthesis
MNISIVIPFVYPFEIGGAQIHAYYLAKVLSRQNSVSVLSKGKNQLCQKIEGSDFVLVEDIDKFFVGSVASFFNYFRELSKRQPSIIIVDFLTGSVSELAVVLLSILYKIPYIVTVHGHEIKKNDFFSKIVQRIVFFFAKRVLVVSKELFNALIRNFQISNNKIIVVPNGYDREEIEQIKTKITNYGERKKRIIYAGRLSPVKDPKTILESLKFVLENGVDAQLFVVGGGPLLSEMKKYCFDKNLFHNVTFTGQADHANTLQLIANSDLLVLSSLEEGTPLVIIEAMALGKPVVATRVGGIPEIVENRKNGILVEPRSPKQMATAISQILVDMELYQSFSLYAYEKAKPYTWENVCERYERIIQDLLQ